MNAPAAPAAVAREAKLELIPIGRLRPSGTHIQELRRARFDQKVLQELADSIRKVGILQPIVARPLKADGGFEIVAGERRWLAGKLAGLGTINASVSELTDEEVLEIQLIENLQREGLHELEEAEGYDELMKLKNINADAVAGMVGKSRSYVYARTKLLALCPEVRKDFYAGKLDASTALLIARIPPHELQRRAVQELETLRQNGELRSFRDAQRLIREHFMLRLKQAPFDLNDAQLVPKAGSCAACPKRVGNQRDLFPDVQDADVCTDPKCFQEKREAHHAGARKALEAKGRKVIHGEAAKKIFPRWEDGDDGVRGSGHVKLSDTTYTTGANRKVADVLGPDYQPVTVQHPLTGKFVELARESDLAKASQSPRRSSYPPAGQAKPEGPDVDEDEFKALLKLIHGKLPKELTRPQLLLMARCIWRSLNIRRYGEEAICTAWGWKDNALDGGGYSEKLPKVVAALKTPDLLKFFFEAAFATCYTMERKSFLDLFGMKESKIREQVIADRKKAQAAARVAKVNAAIEKRAKKVSREGKAT